MPRERASLSCAGAVLGAFLAAGPAAAEGWDAARFDPLRTVETATDGAAKPITGTVDADFVVRGSDTDMPAVTISSTGLRPP